MSTSDSDPFDLQRFRDAQRNVFSSVVRELEQGRKTSHWMWFIFPQVRGLGSSAMAERYGICGLSEAQAYLADLLLGPRLIQCAALVNQVKDRPLRDILGYPDDLKFRSCMTLFAQARPDTVVFEQALQKFWNGQADPATLDLLD